eukprot:TRINITY_DN2862_c0_g1_i2.p1 TRINITY_DN2862_c0_g1~~TRINITY_DN2862_c0_g1_i2.p1  ORF type:complete len:412 (-),score=111.29 TRINITY_DN2862_c0_g1_i2:86-1294(-)
MADVSEPSFGHLQLSVVEGRNINSSRNLSQAAPDSDAESDEPIGLGGIVRVSVGEWSLATEERKGPAPKWLTDFKFPLASLKVEVKVVLELGSEGGEGGGGASATGSCTLQMEDIMTGGTMVRWHDMMDKDGNFVGEICLVLRYSKQQISSASSSMSMRGVGSRSLSLMARDVPPSNGRSEADDVDGSDAANNVSSSNRSITFPGGKGSSSAGGGSGGISASGDSEQSTRANSSFSTREFHPQFVRKAGGGSDPSSTSDADGSHGQGSVSASDSSAGRVGTRAMEFSRNRLQGEDGPSPDSLPLPSVSPEKKRGEKGSGLKQVLIAGLLMALGAGVSLAMASLRRRSIVHKVVHGDTIYDIAGTYGVAMDEVIEANAPPIADDPDLILPGEEIVVPRFRLMH